MIFQAAAGCLLIKLSGSVSANADIQSYINNHIGRQLLEINDREIGRTKLCEKGEGTHVSRLEWLRLYH